MPPFPNILRIGLTFDLSTTDLNITSGHLLIKDYLRLKFLGHRILELPVAEGVRDQLDLDL